MSTRRIMCHGRRSSADVRPIAPNISASDIIVSAWKFFTRVRFFSGASPATKSGSWVATPAGQTFALQRRAWMHPSASIIPRAEYSMSAPSDSRRIMPKPVVIFPVEIILIFSRTPNPIRALWAKIRASIPGEPMWFENSRGAAPVPPSPPSMVIKSGVIPVLTIALQIARNSRRLPMQSLNPIGLPSESFLSWATNCIRPTGVEKELWVAGEITSLPMGTLRIFEISSLTFIAGRIPPCPGFAPCESLISIILTCGLTDFSANIFALKFPSSVLQPK